MTLALSRILRTSLSLSLFEQGAGETQSGPKGGCGYYAGREQGDSRSSTLQNGRRLCATTDLQGQAKKESYFEEISQ